MSAHVLHPRTSAQLTMLLCSAMNCAYVEQHFVLVRTKKTQNKQLDRPRILHFLKDMGTVCQLCVGDVRWERAHECVGK